MKKTTFTGIVVVLATLCLFQGCMGVIGQGPVITAEKKLDGFDAVDVSNSFKVFIDKSDHFQVLVKTHENLMRYVTAKVEGKTLYISMEQGLHFSRIDGEVRIAMPELRGVGLSGACDGVVSGDFRTDDLKIVLSGASDLAGTIAAQTASFDLSGASKLTLRGNARTVRAEGSGASDLILDNFPVGTLSLELSGASSASIPVSGKLDASLSGASHLTYTGEPTLGSIETSGASSIQRRQ